MRKASPGKWFGSCGVHTRSMSSKMYSLQLERYPARPICLYSQVPGAEKPIFRFTDPGTRTHVRPSPFVQNCAAPAVNGRRSETSINASNIGLVFIYFLVFPFFTAAIRPCPVESALFKNGK